MVPVGCFFLKRIQYNLESRRTVYDGQTESFPACTARSNQIRLACTPGKHDIRLWQRVLYCLLYQVPIGQPVRGTPPLSNSPIAQHHRSASPVRCTQRLPSENFTVPPCNLDARRRWRGARIRARRKCVFSNTFYQYIYM